jgi:hypothetical protein
MVRNRKFIAWQRRCIGKVAMVTPTQVSDYGGAIPCASKSLLESKRIYQMVFSNNIGRKKGGIQNTTNPLSSICAEAKLLLTTLPP